MSREWKYFWLRLILCMLFSLCVGTTFINLGHSLSSVVVRVAAVFVFVSFISLLSIAGMPALIKEIKVIMKLVAGYFRIRDELPELVWTYPLSYITFHTYSIQGLLENEYVGTSFAVGQVRTITGVQALHSAYNISPNSNAKWGNLLILLLMATGYRIILFFLLYFRVRKNTTTCVESNRNTNTTR